MPMDVRSIPGATLGAVVHGAHLAGDMDKTQFEEIRAALDAHLVLVFRGHKALSYEEFLALGRRFGYVPKTGLTSGAHPDHNEILIVSNLVEDGRKIGVGDADWMCWHTDYSFRPRVSKVGFLEAVEVPSSGGGETLFTDTYALYESLSPEARQRLHSYRARHALRIGYEETVEKELQREVSLGESTEQIQPEDGTSTIHPLIARNPRTGRQSVYVSTLNTKEIVNLTPEASRRLLDELLSHAGKPQYTYAHNWQPRDIVMWDQLGTVHAKQAFDPSERRIMRQVVSIFDDPNGPWRTEIPA